MTTYTITDALVIAERNLRTMPRVLEIIVFAAVQGNLFGPGGDRGVYRTTDAGATWKQVLKVDADTGANEVVMDPSNSRILYASTYQRRRSTRGLAWR